MARRAPYVYVAVSQWDECGHKHRTRSGARRCAGKTLGMWGGASGTARISKRRRYSHNGLYRR